LPVPLLLGPNTAMRLNGVDIPNAPLKINEDGTLSIQQVGTLQSILNLMGKEELGIKVEVDDISGKEMATGMEKGFWAKAGREVNQALVGVLVKPFVQGVSVLGNLGRLVDYVFMGDKAGMKDALRDTWNSLTAIPASWAGYILEKIPFRTVKEFGEKLSNWSLGHGWGFTNSDIWDLSRPNPNKKIGLFLGINNGVTEAKGVDKNGNPKYFRVHWDERTKRALTDSLLEPIFDEIDPIPVYTGNFFADVIYVMFNRAGWSVASQNLLGQIGANNYEAVIAYSGGGPFVKAHESEIQSDLFGFVGAPGIEKNWYKGANIVVAHEKDLVTNIGIQEDGKRMGLSLNFRFGKGTGNILRTKAPESRIDPGNSSPHAVEKYLEEVALWLNQKKH